MSFNAAIPQVTDPRSQSAIQMRANFQAINSVFNVNHVPINGDPVDGYLGGQHTVLTLRSQTIDPVTSADEVAIYNKLVTGIPELFYAPSSAQTPIQLTRDSIDTDTANAKYTFIAGPFTLYGGLIANPTDGQVVNLSPSTTLIYVGLVVANANLTFPTRTYSACATTLAANSFTIRYSANLTDPNDLDVYYFAVGV